MLEVKKLSISYGKKEVFKNLSFKLKKGDIMGVLGKNGSGKSSLCLAICDILDGADIKGEIIIDGKNIKKLSRVERCKNVAMIFQEPETQLFSPTVEDELSFAPENLCIERDEIKKRIENALKICNIKDLRYRFINTLSGGEKQLVAIASILTMSPKIILADEITSRIDKQGVARIRDCFKKFSESGGSVIMVTHNKDDLKICNKTINLGMKNDES